MSARVLTTVRTSEGLEEVGCDACVVVYRHDVHEAEMASWSFMVADDADTAPDTTYKAMVVLAKALIDTSSLDPAIRAACEHLLQTLPPDAEVKKGGPAS